MKVVQFSQYGAPEVLHLAEAPMPEPGAGEARIRIVAAAVNPADPKWRQGMFQSFAPVPLPHVVGYDVAGEVDAVGPGVAGLALGERVMVMLNAGTKGGYAEYAVAPADTFVKLPAGLEFAAAAAIPTAGLTGVQMVEEHADAKAGDLLLITGATGAVGRFALHAALGRKAKVIAAVRASQADEARALGASDVVVLGEQEWTGPAFTHVIDTVGGAAVAELCHHLQPGGSIFTASTTPVPAEGLSTEPIFVMVHSDPARLADLAADVSAGLLPVPIALRLPLSDAAEAHRLVEAGGQGGKIILEP